jgi:hypothetical protein
MRVSSDPYYLDGRPRVEVVAQSEDGRVVQLTELTEPDTKVASARWATRDGVADGKLSFVEMSYSAPGWTAGGLYAIEIGWTEAGEPVAMTEPAEVVPVVGVPSGSYGWSYDWSPDGEHLLRQSGDLVYIDDSATPLCSGWGPKWSPVRPDGSTLIAFGVDIWGGEIHTIRPDGSGETSIVSVSNQQTVDCLAWSPHGTYLVYDVSKTAKIGISQSTRDVFRVGAQGGGSTNLTGDVSGGVGSFGWRD